MLITGVKSRPQYRPLQFDSTGRCHVLIGQGEGGAALARLWNETPSAADVRLLYTGQSLTKGDWSDPFPGGDARITLLPTPPAALDALQDVLSRCVMGTRLYVAGSESFIGSVEQIAAQFNLQSDEVQSEHVGSSARRVYCIHCRHSNEDVTTNVVRCGGCGRQLIVRDHYSRRLAAFMGVMADAETPGVLPEVREVFA